MIPSKKQMQSPRDLVVDVVADVAAKVRGDGGHFFKKQPKVAFVTADGELPTHFLMQGRLPLPQGHLGTEHANTLAQS